MHDFALELGDRAPLRSTITRAVRLFEGSALELGDFISYLQAARSQTREHQGSIRGPRVAYYFAVLEDLLGLRQHPERAENQAQERPARLAPSAAAKNPSDRRVTRRRRSILGDYVRMIPEREDEAP
jgi:hypothetical protein